MQSHNLVQGSADWHAYRKNHFNASDVPAMMGVSQYKSRTELLHERHTGLIKEVDAGTQKRFDAGHRFEALTRPLAEQIIGEELSPVTGSDGEYSASFDGLTMMEDVAFEHKSLNNEIRATEFVEDLHIQYRCQMEQQLMVSGADKVLFLATKWDEYGELLESKYFWYEPNLELRQKIIDGWAQFKIDLANYVPVEIVEMPKAQVTLALPALFIQARGEITENNMAEYGVALALRLKEVRSIVLVSDQDFSNAKEAAKLLRENIEQAKLAKEAMLSQTVTVGEAARMIDAWCEDMRLTALQLENDVKKEDLAKKEAMIKAAQDNFYALIKSLDAKVSPIKLNLAMPQFATSIKGKSKFSSMQDAINLLTSQATIEANKIAMDILNKQVWMQDAAVGYEFLFSDLQQVIFKQEDDFVLLAETRIKNHKENEAKKEADIKAQAEADAKAKLDAENAAKSALELAATNTQSEDASHKLESGDGGATPLNPDNHIPATTKMVEPVIEQIAEPVTKYFYGNAPTAQELINTIAMAYKVNPEIAEKWLNDAFLRAAA